LKLSAPVETSGVELLKFGETFQVVLMAIPSEAPKGERVEARRAAPKEKSMVKG